MFWLVQLFLILQNIWRMFELWKVFRMGNFLFWDIIYDYDGMLLFRVVVVVRNSFCVRVKIRLLMIEVWCLKLGKILFMRLVLNGLLLMIVVRLLLQVLIRLLSCVRVVFVKQQFLKYWINFFLVLSLDWNRVKSVFLFFKLLIIIGIVVYLFCSMRMFGEVVSVWLLGCGRQDRVRELKDRRWGMELMVLRKLLQGNLWRQLSVLIVLVYFLDLMIWLYIVWFFGEFSFFVGMIFLEFIMVFLKRGFFL